VTSDPVVPRDGVALVRLSVSPDAKSTGFRGPCGAAFRLRTAPPVRGKANTEVERFLAEEVGAEPSRERVVRGFPGRDKTVLVDGVAAARVRAVLLSRPV
jgi:uncharacterized protein YggU (UPF0235/DUF167 family)